MKQTEEAVLDFWTEQGEPDEDFLVLEVYELETATSERCEPGPETRAFVDEYARRGWCATAEGKIFVTEAKLADLKADAHRVRNEVAPLLLGWQLTFDPTPVIVDGEVYARWSATPRAEYASETDAFLALGKALAGKIALEHVARYFRVFA